MRGGGYLSILTLFIFYQNVYYSGRLMFTPVCFFTDTFTYSHNITKNKSPTTHWSIYFYCSIGLLDFIWQGMQNVGYLLFLY